MFVTSGAGQPSPWLLTAAMRPSQATSGLWRQDRDRRCQWRFAIRSGHQSRPHQRSDCHPGGKSQSCDQRPTKSHCWVETAKDINGWATAVGDTRISPLTRRRTDLDVSPLRTGSSISLVERAETAIKALTGRDTSEFGHMTKRPPFQMRGSE